MISDQNKKDLMYILDSHFPIQDNNSLRNFQKLTGGTDTEIFSFDLYSNNSSIKLVMKLFRNRIPSSRAKNEYLNLCKLSKTNIHIPKPFGFLDKTCSFNRPFMIMEYIDGGLLTEKLYRLSRIDNTLFKAFVANLILIHQTNWHILFDDFVPPDIGSDPYIIIKSFINRTETIVKEYDIKEFDPLIDWLKINMISYPCKEFVLCHGDYHPNNIILNNNNNELVTFDWSNIGLGDRRQDLAFAIVVMNSLTSIDQTDLIITTYERITDIIIEGIKFFEVLTNLFNFLRLYSAACNFTITQETEQTKKVFLNEYKTYSSNVLKLMKSETTLTFPTIEHFLR